MRQPGLFPSSCSLRDSSLHVASPAEKPHFLLGSLRPPKVTVLRGKKQNLSFLFKARPRTGTDCYILLVKTSNRLVYIKFGRGPHKATTLGIMVLGGPALETSYYRDHIYFIYKRIPQSRHSVNICDLNQWLPRPIDGLVER